MSQPMPWLKYSQHADQYIPPNHFDPGPAATTLRFRRFYGRAAHRRSQRDADSVTACARRSSSAPPAPLTRRTHSEVVQQRQNSAPPAPLTRPTHSESGSAATATAVALPSFLRHLVRLYPSSIANSDAYQRLEAVMHAVHVARTATQRAPPQ